MPSDREVIARKPARPTNHRKCALPPTKVWPEPQVGDDDRERSAPTHRVLL